jgi:acyl-CoA thioester hydrolase
VFVHGVRVLYGDTDAAGIVYHANYLRFFEAARGEFLRARGLPYAEIERRGLVWPIVESGLRHRRPARYDDLLRISLRVTALGAASVTFDYEALLDSGEVSCSGFTRLACTTRADGRVAPIPPDIRAVLRSGAPEGVSLPRGRRPARPPD